MSLREVRQWAVDATKGIRSVTYDWRRKANASGDYPMTTVSVPNAERASAELQAKLGGGDVRAATVEVEARALTMGSAYDELDAVEEAFSKAQVRGFDVEFASYEATWSTDGEPVVTATASYMVLHRG